MIQWCILVQNYLRLGGGPRGTVEFSKVSEVQDR